MRYYFDIFTGDHWRATTAGGIVRVMAPHVVTRSWRWQSLPTNCCNWMANRRRWPSVCGWDNSPLSSSSWRSRGSWSPHP